MTDIVLQRAIDIAGGQSALARKIGTRQSHIWHWLTRAKRGVPAEYCLAIERETGVAAAELRPDLYRPNNHTSSPFDNGENGTSATSRPVPNTEAPAQGAGR